MHSRQKNNYEFSVIYNNISSVRLDKLYVNMIKLNERLCQAVIFHRKTAAIYRRQILKNGQQAAAMPTACETEEEYARQREQKNENNNRDEFKGRSGKIHGHGESRIFACAARKADARYRLRLQYT